MFDTVVVVTSKMKNRLERIKKRDKLSEKEISDRMSKQIPIEDKMKWADHLIENNGTLEELQDKTKKLFHILKAETRKKSRMN
jgi:dephospho-CoA kinase